jgi:hypothetical protein
VVPDVSEERIASIFRVVEYFSKAASKQLHGVISQKKILFKTTAVKTSNPTYF